MSKMDEAIALAKEIVERANKDPETPNWYRIAGTKAHRLARALLDSTSPGAQYRAGMERLDIHRIVTDAMILGEERCESSCTRECRDDSTPSSNICHQTRDAVVAAVHAAIVAPSLTIEE